MSATVIMMPAVTYDLAGVIRIYQASDAEASKALYDHLAHLGVEGAIASALLRACKASERAKQYRGRDRRGTFRSQAYGRKEFAIQNVVALLVAHANDASLRWGWGVDETRQYHRAVIYVDLPTGQVSFHLAARGDGPEYPGSWDGMRGQSADRILRWTGRLLREPTEAHA